jgi:hypothetical protein
MLFRKGEFTEKHCSGKQPKCSLVPILVTTISPEYLIRLSWNFQFLPNCIRSIYCINISQIGDIDWAMLVVANVPCLLRCSIGCATKIKSVLDANRFGIDRHFRPIVLLITSIPEGRYRWCRLKTSTPTAKAPTHFRDIVDPSSRRKSEAIGSRYMIYIQKSPYIPCRKQMKPSLIDMTKRGCASRSPYGFDNNSIATKDINFRSSLFDKYSLERQNFLFFQVKNHSSL